MNPWHLQVPASGRHYRGDHIRHNRPPLTPRRIAMTDLAPQTPIETLLKAAMDGSVPIRAFMEAFVASEVVLLTGSLVTPDGSGFDPLLFDKQGTLHVAVFTDPSRVGICSQQAEHQIRWRMLDVLRRVPGGYGVVINPGTSLGFEISPSGVGEILKDFAQG